MNPVTGAKLETKDLIRLHYSKNGEGDLFCPISLKTFSDNSHIVAIATTGNVYSYEAIDKFNIQAKHWKDLLTDEPFTRKDIITLQDPSNPEKHNVSKFHHLKFNLTAEDEEEAEARQRPDYVLRSAGSEAKAALAELYEKREKWDTKQSLKSSVDSQPASAPKDAEHTATFSTGEMAMSFTSTHMTPRTHNTAAAIDDDTVRYSRIKTKGYVTLRTSLGELNFELHCDLTPRTCDNFLRHCSSGYYKNTKFHRSIRNFMIQGGDPTGTGFRGESAFPDGKPFADEFRGGLSHSARGMLSMANSGPNTNKSQFFITFRACTHLDRKNTIFGKLVGGMGVLDEMERVPTDRDDRPRQDIVLLETLVFVNPFEDADKKRTEEEEAKKKKERDAQAAAPPVALREGVGKYLKATSYSDASAASAAAAARTASASSTPSSSTTIITTTTTSSSSSSSSLSSSAASGTSDSAAKRARVEKTVFKNFSGW